MSSTGTLTSGGKLAQGWTNATILEKKKKNHSRNLFFFFSILRDLSKIRFKIQSDDVSSSILDLSFY